jgi:signal transduction histidine kinase
VLVSISAEGIRTAPERRLRYQPYVLPQPPAARVEALVQRAQVNIRTGAFAEALGAYQKLSAFRAQPVGDVVGGIPAGLFALLGQITVREKQGDPIAVMRAARELNDALRASRWPISAATFEFLTEQVRQRLIIPPAVDPQLVLAEAASWLWDQRASGAGFAQSGRESRVFPSGPAVIVWRSSPHAMIAWIAGADALRAEWLPALNPLIERRRAGVAITTGDGQPIVGAISAHDRPALRFAANTGLPWTIQVTNRADDSALDDRQRLWIIGMTILILLIVAGAWLIERTIARELAVADLQSDFVAAVSHEFRTPLTTLCQLSELLMRGRVSGEADRAQYYELLHGESQRLRRLVETLLNFGRLDAGRMEFRFNTIELGALTRHVAEEFGASPSARRHRVQLTTDDDPISLRADREVMRTVIWNLLDNAAKYSPDCDTIWMTVSRQDSTVVLTVRDRGVGIPRAEQRQVFDKFVRGAGARASDVGGSGVGLAMAQRMVEAHGGSITVESQPGVGSTFTVALPAIDAQVRADLKVGSYDVEVAG